MTTFHVHNEHYTTQSTSSFYGTVQSADGKIFIEDNNFKNSMVGKSPSRSLESFGHYKSESNGNTRVYRHMTEESESFLVGYVNTEGKFFSKSGDLLGRVDDKGRVYDSEDGERSRMNLRVNIGTNFEDARVDLVTAQQEKITAELLVKVGGVAALLFGF